MKTLEKMPTGTTRQTCMIECELKNETNAMVTVCVCNAYGCTPYHIPRHQALRPVWMTKGANAVAVFNMETGDCLRTECYDISGPVAIPCQV